MNDAEKTKNLEKLKYSLKHNNPNLFLGAGFSLGAKQKNNLPIPSGAELKKMIISNILGISEQDNEYDEVLNSSLCSVCTFAQNGGKKEELSAYLQSIFQGVKPADFHLSYVRYPWHNIYSTNIDDVIEQACKSVAQSVVVHVEKHNPQISKEGELTLYKLHGCVNNPKEGFIFDEEEYVDSVLNRTDHKFGNLAIEFQTKDFIFVGSNFDDFNIKYYLKLYGSTSSKSGRGTLFFVNPKPSYALKSSIKKEGGILIEQTAEEFALLLDEVLQDLNHTDESRLLYNGFLRLKSLKEKMAVEAEANSYNTNFYMGAAPRWGDIIYDWDIQLPPALEAFRNSLSSFDTDENSALVYTVYGGGCSGKSTLIKRLAMELLDANYEVILYEGKIFDSKRLLQYIEKSNYERYALVIDDASYNYQHIAYLCKNIARGIKLCVLSASGKFLHNKRRYCLSEVCNVEYELAIRPDTSIAEATVDKLKTKGYLGSILRECPTPKEQIRYVGTFWNVAEAIFAITHGRNFKLRFTNQVAQIFQDANYRGALIKLALFRKMQLAYCPRELFVTLYKRETDAILNKMEDLLKEPDSLRLEIKNDYIANVILKKSSEEERIEALKDLLTGISPMVENTSSSYWNEIQSVLMREKLICENLHIRSPHLKKMLYEIRDYYHENYNYWLQLGIAEQQTGDYEKALIHFDQAQVYNPNSYMVKNAIGRNYIQQAIKERDDEVAKRLFETGKEMLFELITNREEYQARAYSTHTYLTGLMNFYGKKQRLKISSRDLQEAKSLITKIYAKYKDDPIFKRLNAQFTQFSLQNSRSCNLEELKSAYAMGTDLNFEEFYE